MNTPQLTMAQKVAQAAVACQEQRTGHAPDGVTVVLGAQTLVVTLDNALTPAEKELAQSVAGATYVQEFHRQLFAASVDVLRQEIERITGVGVRESAAEVETATGAVVHAFASGSMVQVFLLTEGISDRNWNGIGPDDSVLRLTN